MIRIWLWLSPNSLGLITASVWQSLSLWAEISSLLSCHFGSNCRARNSFWHVCSWNEPSLAARSSLLLLPALIPNPARLLARAGVEAVAPDTSLHGSREGCLHESSERAERVWCPGLLLACTLWGLSEKIRVLVHIFLKSWCVKVLPSPCTGIHSIWICFST